MRQEPQPDNFILLIQNEFDIQNPALEMSRKDCLVGRNEACCPEFLDPALLQPGRFGRILHFQKPNQTQRERYFTVMLSRMLIDPQEIDIQTLAHETTGCSLHPSEQGSDGFGG